MNERGAPLLEISGLRKDFLHRGKLIRVLKGIDLQVRQGEMCAVVGASGAGKSTFLHVVGTLDQPSAGHIRFRGEDVTSFAPRKLSDFRNRTIGFVFQFHHLLPEFTALENTMMPGLIQRMPRERIEHDARMILEEVGLGHRLTHKPGELSGGEQQRVALARALVLHPALLLADEPTGNLDANTSEGIHDLFFDMNERYGTTMLLVTHNPSLAKRMPRTLKLEDGVISDVEGREDVAAEPREEERPPEIEAEAEAPTEDREEEFHDAEQVTKPAPEVRAEETTREEQAEALSAENAAEQLTEEEGPTEAPPAEEEAAQPTDDGGPVEPLPEDEASEPPDDEKPPT